MNEHDEDDFGTPYREVATELEPSPARVRAWARARNLPVGKRGRLSSDLFLAYAQWSESQRTGA